jgi:catechol 2,3-dioxygenase-like lactoylglutathione lyase family enzyme
MRMAGAAAGLLLGMCAVPAAAAPTRPPIVAVSHLAVYSADMAASETFYAGQLGAIRQADPEHPGGVRYRLSASQFVEVLPLPPGSITINRLAHVAFVTTDVAALRAYLAARGAAVPAQVTTGADGSRWIDLTDPEGTPVQFVQPPGSVAPVAAPAAASHRMIHVGFIVHHRTREDGFWRDLLGFRPYWSGGVHPDQPTWISLQVPDGSDWLEYMVVGTPDATGIPPGMTQSTLGVLNHFALGVTDMRATYTGLWTGKRLEGQKPDAVPKIGLDAKWQLNLIDPDGTRAEFMEYAPIGTPCCSPFTAPHPRP